MMPLIVPKTLLIKTYFINPLCKMFQDNKKKKLLYCADTSQKPLAQHERITMNGMRIESSHEKKMRTTEPSVAVQG